jgi:hypothetical protein
MALAPTVVTTALVLGSGHTHPAAAASPPVFAYRVAFLVLGGVAMLTALYAFSLGRPAARTRLKARRPDQTVQTGCRVGRAPMHSIQPSENFEF